MLRTSLQALAFVVLFYSVFNMAYAVVVTGFVRSWNPMWAIDRRFPFSLIPLWLFALVSFTLFMISFCHYLVGGYRPKLKYDRANTLLVYVATGGYLDNYCTQHHPHLLRW